MKKKIVLSKKKIPSDILGKKYLKKKRNIDITQIGNLVIRFRTPVKPRIFFKINIQSPFLSVKKTSCRIFNELLKRFPLLNQSPLFTYAICKVRKLDKLQNSKPA